jgi:uncharacterized membrane protein YccC
MRQGGPHEIELARVHRAQISNRIAEQTKRVERLRALGANTRTAEDLLKLLCNGLDSIDGFIARQTDPMPDED